MRGFLGILGVLFVALFAGAIGFWAGVASGAGSAVVAGGATVPAFVWWGGPHIGGLVFGFLFLFLFVGLIAFAFGGHRRGPWGRGWHRGWGYDPMGDPSDPRRQWIAEAHRRLHEEDARHGDRTGSSGRPGTSGQPVDTTQAPNDASPAPPSA